MRVSSNTFFDSNVAAMGQQQMRLLQTQQQISTGRRMQTPADDPVAAAQALNITQADAMNTQYASNRNAVRHTLSLSEAALQGVTSLLQDVRQSVIAAGNGSMGDADRKSIANNLNGRLQELMGFANSTDGIGNYLFAGFQSKTQPFADNAGVVAYLGDDGQRLIQVNASRQMAASEVGADVFMRIKNGNGTFVTKPGPANAGTGAASTGSVVNAALVTGNSYQIDFSVVAGVTTYSVTDTTLGAVISSGNPYVSGQAISFDGLQFSINGAPADLDSFTVSPSSNESIFTTIKDLITSLETPGTNGLAGRLGYGLSQMDRALDTVLTSRASLGVRLAELDSLGVAGEDLGLQYKQSLSILQDVDYNKALSDLTQQQMLLQAAQQSFSKVAGLSMFDYL